MENVYVFVVCGAAEHINTLYFSIPYLKNRTKNRVVVVTDSQRNEIEILHDDVVDIRVNPSFDNHQASIWLKTSLHRLLPSGNKYAYLDTDVIAIGNHPDGIFDQYIPPIRFAADHCRMKQFSPYAVNCPCLPENIAYREKVNALIEKQDPLSKTQDQFLLQHRANLQRHFQHLKQSRLKAVMSAFRFVFSGNKFHLSEQYYFDKKKKAWHTREGVAVMYQVSMRKIAKEVGLRYLPIKNDILRADGRSIWRDSCTHLQQYVFNKFNINITEADWQHWNGGAFLFSVESNEFMETWHQFTLEIFKDKNWKTRDQGTLIATVWKLGLQNQPVLDDIWNYIADYYNQTLEVNEEKNEISKDGKIFTKPELIHIYHHFGDKNWKVWKWITNHVNK